MTFPVIGWHGPVQPDPELDKLLAEEEDIQRRNTAADRLVETGRFTFPVV